MNLDSLHVQAEANICNEIWPHRVVFRVMYTDSRRVDHVVERELFVNKALEDFDVMTPGCVRVNYMEMYIPANTCLLPLTCSTLVKKYYIHVNCPTLQNLQWYVDNDYLLRAGDAGPMGSDPDRLTVPTNALLFYDVQRQQPVLGAPSPQEGSQSSASKTEDMLKGIGIGLGIVIAAGMISAGIMSLMSWVRRADKNSRIESA